MLPVTTRVKSPRELEPVETVRDVVVGLDVLEGKASVLAIDRVASLGAFVVTSVRVRGSAEEVEPGVKATVTV
jgi:hypothetical protein